MAFGLKYLILAMTGWSIIPYGRYGYGHPLDQWQMYGIAATNVGWPTESKC